jgi:hypothetical protein
LFTPLLFTHRCCSRRCSQEKRAECAAALAAALAYKLVDLPLEAAEAAIAAAQEGFVQVRDLHRLIEPHHPWSVSPCTNLSTPLSLRSNLSTPLSLRSNLSTPLSLRSNLSIPLSLRSNLSIPDHPCPPIMCCLQAEEIEKATEKVGKARDGMLLHVDAC